jgi:hypothetical protein
MILSKFDSRNHPLRRIKKIAHQELVGFVTEVCQMYFQSQASCGLRIFKRRRTT